MRTVFDAAAAKYTVIITPSAMDKAPLGIEEFGIAVFNFFWTVRSQFLNLIIL